MNRRKFVQAATLTTTAVTATSATSLQAKDHKARNRSVIRMELRIGPSVWTLPP